MGKYMKKCRTSSIGVRTRANSSDYLQLRSRRLLKLQPPPPPPPQRKENSVEIENSRLKENSEKIASLSSVNESGKVKAEEESVDLGMKGSCGENFLVVEAIDSLVMDSNSITTIPVSTTRQRTHQTNHENVQRIIPTDQEFDEFFAHAERQQQAMFIEKYNFDIVNDVPLQGRYKWVLALN